MNWLKSVSVQNTTCLFELTKKINRFSVVRLYFVLNNNAFEL